MAVAKAELQKVRLFIIKRPRAYGFNGCFIVASLRWPVDLSNIDRRMLVSKSSGYRLTDKCEGRTLAIGLAGPWYDSGATLCAPQLS